MKEARGNTTPKRTDRESQGETGSVNISINTEGWWKRYVTYQLYKLLYLCHQAYSTTVTWNDSYIYDVKLIQRYSYDIEIKCNQLLLYSNTWVDLLNITQNPRHKTTRRV